MQGGFDFLATRRGPTFPALRQRHKCFARNPAGLHPAFRPCAPLRMAARIREVSVVKGGCRLDLRFCEIRPAPDRHTNKKSASAQRHCPGQNPRLLTSCEYASRVICIRQMRNAARMRRRRPPGKTGHGQIEAAPEKMHRTAFAAKTRPELLEDAVALNKDAPEAIGILAVVRTVFFIFIKRDRVFDLVRHLVDGHRQTQFVELFATACKNPPPTGFQFNRSPRRHRSCRCAVGDR